MKIKRIAAFAALSFLLLAVSSCRKDPLGILTWTLPDFSVIMNGGETVNALTLFGTPAVICTFNTGDVCSVKMLSMLQSLYEQYRRTVKFVMISDGEPEEDILSFWVRHGFSLPFSAQQNAAQAGKFSSDVPFVMVISGGSTILGEFDRDRLPTRAELDGLIRGSAD